MIFFVENGVLTLSWHGFSQGNIRLIPLPSALSTSRTERTSSVSSAGSSDASWSLPFHVLSKVMWRSTTFAPRATAATVILTPDSCPEYPMGISGNSFWYSCSQQVGDIHVILKSYCVLMFMCFFSQDATGSCYWHDIKILFCRSPVILSPALKDKGNLKVKLMAVISATPKPPGTKNKL